MSTLHQIYSFWFYADETRVTVSFLGPSDWRFSGPDHTYPHQARRNWATSLMEAYPDSWRAIPPNQYLDVLKHRGFEYDEFLIQKKIAPTEIHIICRSALHL